MSVTKIVSEFVDKITQDFASSVKIFFPESKISNNLKALQDISRVEAQLYWKDKPMLIRLDFIDNPMIYVILMTPAREGTPTKHQKASEIAFVQTNNGYHWIEARTLDAFSDFEDDFFEATPPSASRFISGLLKTDRGKQHLSYVINDDEILNKLNPFDEISQSALQATKKYLKYSTNPWAELKQYDSLSTHDVEDAVGSKIVRILETLKDEGLNEFFNMIYSFHTHKYSAPL